MPRKPDTPCAACGTLLWGGNNSLPPGQRKCQPCRRQATAEHVAGRRACWAVRVAGHVVRLGRTCEACGAKYNASYREQRTCGRACGVDLRRRADTYNYSKRRVSWPSSRVWINDCHQCGEPYAARHPRTTMCGDACRAARYTATRMRVRQEREQARLAQGPRLCTGCHVVEVEYPARTCEACRLVVEKAARRRAKSRRRARHAGAKVVEYIYLPDIAERDGHRCGICRRQVDMTLLVPHPKAPTLDHVVPLARGGDHSKANAQLAHFLCNSRKGDRVGDVQLALFG
jgi:hypothetical protein